MKIFRIILFTAIALGFGLSFSSPPHVSVVPIPGEGSHVDFIVHVQHDGDYRAFVSTPTATQDGVARAKHVTCALEISVLQGNEPAITKRTQTFETNGQIFGMNLDLLRSDVFWSLHKGEKTVRVLGTDNCGSISSRGGSLTFEEDVIDPTAAYLGESLKFLGPRILAALGLLILTVLELMTARPAKGSA